MKKMIDQDQPLLEALRLLYPDSSKTTLRSLLKEERIKVDGQTCKLGTLSLKKGQILEVVKKQNVIAEGVKILYQDPHLAVVFKPSGLLSVSTDFEKNFTLHKILKEHFQPKTVEVVHRLDQDTSGVIVFALDKQTCLKLKILFEKHEIERCYTAIVEGKLTPRSGSWRSYLHEDENYVVHSTDNARKGKLAITHYVVEGYSKKFTRLRLKLETGKKNQIRVHCSDAGHPIAGDTKYGASSNPGKRLMLHADHLGFIHPVKRKKMQFTIDPPESFDKVVLKKRNP